MIEPLRALALRLALCGLFGWILVRAGFAIQALAMVGLAGIVLAKPLIDLAIAAYQALRHAVWQDVQGQHYAYRGQLIYVVTATNQQRWVRLADVRCVVGFTASDGALRMSYPDGFRFDGPAREPHLSGEALLLHLRKERAPEAVRFGRWVEREIVFPARRMRQRQGTWRHTPP